MAKHAITSKVNDELIRYQTVKDYLDSLINNDTELLSVVKHNGGSYSFSITIDERELYFKATFGDIYEKCLDCSVHHIAEHAEKYIISLLRQKIIEITGTD